MIKGTKREREREREVARINHLRGREEERVKRDCRGKGIYNSAHTALLVERGRQREKNGDREWKNERERGRESG